MALITSVGTHDLEATLRSSHFAFVGASDMRQLLKGDQGLDDWRDFAASWDDLPEDTFMADGGRYRKRRHVAFAVGQDVIRKPPQPHYQSRDRNPLNGGIERWFAPVEDHVVAMKTVSSIFGFCRRTLLSVRPDVNDWHVELHQFRILRSPKWPGSRPRKGCIATVLISSWCF